MNARRLPASILCALLLGTSCAAPGRNAGTADPSSAEAAKTADPEPSGELRLSEFIVGVGDELAISVYRHDTLAQSLTVDPSGKIMFPLVGDVQVAGKSVFAVRDELAEKLSRYLVKPKVTVRVTEIRSRRTMVLGEVSSPGSFVLDTELTALDALAKAGGSTNDADLSQVLLVRSAGGKKRVQIPLDLKAALAGTDASMNMTLQNGDVLFVPVRGIANISRYASYIASILSPFVALEGAIVLAPLVKDAITGEDGNSSSDISIPTQ